MPSFTAGSLPLPDSLRIHVRHLLDERSPLRFEVAADTPVDWLREAVALTMSTSADACAHARLERFGDSTVQNLFAPRFGAAESVAVDGDIEFTLHGRRATAPGEPRIRVLDDRTEVLDPRRAAPWFDAPPPFRGPHAQHELERIFGYVMPSPDPCGIPFSGPLAPTAATRALLRSLEPTMRLALRAHLDDVQASGPRTLPARDVEAALAGLSHLAVLVAGDGVPQGEGGWLDEQTLQALEEALQWPDGAGTRLETLARRLRLIRRFRGRVIGTARARQLGASTTVPHVRTLLAPDIWAGGGEAVTLALLIVSDGTAAALDDVAGLVERALRRAGYREGTTSRAAAAAERVGAVLAPLGGFAAYGALTDAVRSIAHEALFLEPQPSRWSDDMRGADDGGFL